VGEGDSVEWFAAGFPGAAPAADLDGIHVVRAGRQWSVHAQAVRRYRGRLAGRFDLVIDEVNTMPFFTPLWADIPASLLIFQLAREVWWYESPFPINAIGYALEPWYLRLYRRTNAYTISASTRDDLRRLGWRAPITVVPIGIEEVVIEPVDRPAVPTFLYVGRLAPSKRVHDIVRAFAGFQATGPPGRLALVGDGPPAYLRRLRRLVSQLGVEHAVELCGRLPVAEKHRRMAQAVALLMTSVREGWGLVVTEAGACGTPAVVYDVAGLRDSVRHQETGLIVAPSPSDLAAAMRRLVADRPLQQRLAAKARAWSQTFSLDRSAQALRAGMIASTE
jgi:glycosyltransferase involved in cell wall biosynthesis